MRVWIREQVYSNRLTNGVWHTIEHGAGSGCELTISTATGTITGITVSDGGTGYAASDAITFIDRKGQGSGAVGAVATVDGDGAIQTVSLTSGGTGYSAADTVVVFDNTNGSGAEGTVTLSGGDFGAITSATVTAPGSGYVRSPNPPSVQLYSVGGSGGSVTLTVVTSGQTAGTISGATVASAGSGYAIPAPVTNARLRVKPFTGNRNEKGIGFDDGNDKVVLDGATWLDKTTNNSGGVTFRVEDSPSTKTPYEFEFYADAADTSPMFETTAALDGDINFRDLLGKTVSSDGNISGIDITTKVENALKNDIENATLQIDINGYGILPGRGLIIPAPSGSKTIGRTDDDGEITMPVINSDYINAGHDITLKNSADGDVLVKRTNVWLDKDIDLADLLRQ